ncbi:MAG: PilZ domain-containing protein [Gammaproteobacteria bacterium]|nr:PilZ domain-containing protein [Gammaproteobacteria bacterium]
MSGVQIMEAEQRKHPRFNPKGLVVTIDLMPLSSEEHLYLEGTIIDMSYSGIKIRLSSEMPAQVPESKIKIHLTLPDSDIPVTINGVIKHKSEKSEFGLHYSDHHSEDQVDNLMFECVKGAHFPHQTEMQL